MSKKKHTYTVERTVALCYVRQSYTEDESDKDSPERQRTLIQQRVEAEGWTAEWYEDAQGHRSGRSVKNRPGWQKLERRLGDPDVVAVVAYDPSRLHRKVWRIGKLLEKVDTFQIQLVFVAPGFNLDTTTAQGRTMLQLMAVMDENYAEDVSRRTKATVEFLRAEGKTVGRQPFGTTRNEEGHLVPSEGGAWFLMDGRFVSGTPDQPPEPGATWRSYYEAARYILTLYTENENGLEKLAYQVNAEGWPFRDRQGNPRPVRRDDIRRVVANWPEYGGLVPEIRAKDRPAYAEDVNPAHLIEERAVFPLDLLRRVAETRLKRTQKPKGDGIQKRTRAYPLSGLVYCAHCEQLAKEQEDPRLRARLTGLVDPRGKRRYKHKTGVLCGCENRTVPADEIEAEFARLLKLLTIREEALDYMTELAIQSEQFSDCQPGERGPRNTETAGDSAVPAAD